MDARGNMVVEKIFWYKTSKRLQNLTRVVWTMVWFSSYLDRTSEAAEEQSEDFPPHRDTKDDMSGKRRRRLCHHHRLHLLQLASPHHSSALSDRAVATLLATSTLNILQWALTTARRRKQNNPDEYRGSLASRDSQ